MSAAKMSHACASGWSETQVIVLAFNGMIEGCYKTLKITFLEHEGLWFKCKQRYRVVELVFYSTLGSLCLLSVSKSVSQSKPCLGRQ